MSIELHNSPIDPEERYGDFIDAENYATSKKHLERAERITKRLDLAKSERETISQMWARFYRVWEGSHDVRFYDGESDLRLRLTRKLCDTATAHTLAAAFPGQELFTIEPTDQESAINGEIAKSLIEHDLEQAEIGLSAEQFIDMLWVHGISFYRVDWKTVETKNYTLKNQEDGSVRFVAEPLFQYEGPNVEIVDPQRVFAWPITAQKLEDLDFLYEEKDVRVEDLIHNAMRKGEIPEDGRARMYSLEKIRDYLRRKEDGEKGTKDADNPPREGNIALNLTGDTDAMRDFRLETLGYSTATAAQDRIRVKEVWGRLDLYGDHKVVPVKMTILDDGTVIELRQNPFIHQQIPFLIARMKSRLDNFYGQGMIELLEDYQYGIDALLNLGLDNVNFQSNPIIQYNAHAVDPEDIEVGPRRLWPSDGPPRQNFGIDRPPDIASDTFQAMSTLMGIMQDMAGMPNILQGKAGPRAETAFGLSAIQDAATVFMQKLIKNLERQVYSRMLFMFWKLEQQFRSESAHQKISGFPVPAITAQDLVGDFKLQWLMNDEVIQRLQFQQFEGGVTSVPQEQQGPSPAEQADLIGATATLQGASDSGEG